MGISRRDLLKAAGAGLAPLTLSALPALQAWAATNNPMQLRASAFRQSLRPGAATSLWGFNGSVPGPVLRMKKGDTARILVTNALPNDQGTTVHWHGMRVPNAMDGVPMVTQDPIPTGASFAYEFPLVDSGTFWYHPHQHSFEQVARGLYGAFIVEEEKPIAVDREEVWVLADFKLQPNGQQVNDFGGAPALGGGGRLGNVVTLNGKPVGARQGLELRGGERLRLRLLNTATARILKLDFGGLQPLAVAFDGQAVAPHPLPQGYLLGPGMRLDLVIDAPDAPGQQFAVADTRDKGMRLATISISRKPALRNKPLTDAIALAANALPEPDLNKASQHFIVFEGGVLGKPAIGMIDGKPSPVADIMKKHNLYWTMNYQAEHEHSLMHTPLFHFKHNEHVVLKMVNETEFEHPMHLHGHFFRVLKVNDQPSPHREWRDTVMVAPKGSVDVAFVADNLGEWMFHCHILEHAAGGMMGTVVVE
jgi:FtsP/CotA-like multicopper oxidase with cupredoxin domain